MSLCAACSSIDVDYLSLIDDRKQTLDFPNPSVDRIGDSAASGCAMCICLLASANSRSRPEKVLDHAPVSLRWLNPGHTLGMYVLGDEVSSVKCSFKPPGWSTLPPAVFGQPCPDLDIMNKWVYDCVQHHPNCRSGSTSFIPTRLLDLKAFEGSKDIRLILTEGEATRAGNPNADDSYVALSHCWGPPSRQPLITTSETLKRHTNRIPFSDLSLTFKDAVELTVNIGQRYLWIDSLCIIQDDPTDWEVEAGMMSLVYGNAKVTLSALSSADSTQGCRVASAQERLPNHRFFDLGSGSRQLRIFEGDITEWHNEIGDRVYAPEAFKMNPLHTRAWTLQERLLSIRNISFSNNLILWECRTCRRTSEHPWEDWDPPGDLKFRFPVESSEDEFKLSNEALYDRDYWYDIMEDYMSRVLTHADDKLPALSGLAQDFQTRMPSARYLAGLWSHHLPNNLLWSTDEKPASSRYRATTWSFRDLAGLWSHHLPHSLFWGTDATSKPSSYRAPTWSFLSLDVPISYVSQRVKGYRFHFSTATYEKPSPKCATVSCFNVVPRGNDQYAAVSSASLDMRGAIMSLQLGYPDEESRNELVAMTNTPAGSTGALAGKSYLDCINDLYENMTIWCIAIRPEQYWSVDEVADNLPERQYMSNDEYDSVDGLVMGLILDKVNDQENTYRRIGMIRWMKDSLFDDVPISDFTLI